MLECILCRHEYIFDWLAMLTGTALKAKEAVVGTQVGLENALKSAVGSVTLTRAKY